MVAYFALGAVLLVVEKKENFLLSLLLVQHLALITIASIPHLPLPLVGKKSCCHAPIHMFRLEFWLVVGRR
jgi:hypothetical protein